jgi:hypothetical protein
MKIFRCQSCSQLLHFNNHACERCGHRLGYIAEEGVLSAVQADGDGWTALAVPGTRYRFCDNAGYQACNWLVPEAADGGLCLACRHNRTIPDLSVAENLSRWQACEAAKHHLFYSLLRLQLNPATRLEQPQTGLAFDFLAELPGGGQAKVLTGHEDGVITLNLAEADDVQRERLRVAMGEPYRTLLGHMRHEIGHYYWDRLVQPDADRLAAFRACFGDERQDYAQALQKHYAHAAGAAVPPDFVSLYATSHPWEDFAETWAHYLHIIDTVEMARAYRLHVDLPLEQGDAPPPEIDFDPHGPGDLARVIEAWLPVTLAVNSLNRCMGQPDLYPFVLSPAVVAKLGYVHDLVRDVPMAQAVAA